MLRNRAGERLQAIVQGGFVDGEALRRPSAEKVFDATDQEVGRLEDLQRVLLRDAQRSVDVLFRELDGLAVVEPGGRCEYEHRREHAHDEQHAKPPQRGVVGRSGGVRGIHGRARAPAAHAYAVPEF
jgi:hypothetical protein